MSIDDRVDEEYDERFNEREKEFLKERKAKPEDVNKFNPRFDSLNILKILELNYFSSEANAFHESFRDKDVYRLLKWDVSAKTANEFADLFNHEINAFDIHQLQRFYSSSIETEAKSHGDFSPSEKEINTERVYVWEVFLKYDSRFDFQQRKFMFDAKVDPDIANEYSYDFDFRDIAILFSVDCLPKFANLYSKKLFFEEIRVLFQIGLNPIDMPQLSEDYFARYISDKIFRIKDIKHNLPELQLLGMGAKGIVIQDKKTKLAYKFTVDCDLETKLMKKMSESLSQINNVVKLYEKQGRVYSEVVTCKNSGGLTVYVCGDEKDAEEALAVENIIAKTKTIKRNYEEGTIELEYIQGQTLEHHLEGNKINFSDEEVTKYSAGIFNGLQELKACNIYHRDLWLGNVMIDEEKDRSVIMDLGNATDQPNADKDIGSRRYRGENDIQTLGQLMYKMATGNNLFNTFPDKSTYAVADEVLENILASYSDEKVMAERLKEIDANISNPDLRETIKLCLTAPCRTDNANFATDEVYLRLEERFAVK